MDLAFYGTLRDTDVLHHVVGDALSPFFKETITAQGWLCLRIEGGAYPLLRSEPHAFTTFDLYHDISEESWRRLAEYEGDEYFPASIPLNERFYTVFLPHEALRASTEEWNLSNFQSCYKSQYLKELS